MLFQAELAFESVEDGFDPLTAASEAAVPDGFAPAVRPDQMDAELFGQEILEVLPGEAFVRENHLPGAEEVVVALEKRGHHLPFAELGVGQTPGDGHALGGGDQVEPESPEEAGVAAAEAVSGVAGQLGAFDGLLDAAQGRGVESISLRSSCQVGTCLARASITWEISGPAAFKRLL